MSSFFCVIVLFGLIYAIVFAIGIWYNWSLWLMIGLTIGIILLQYWLGPYIINWIYNIEWIPYEDFQRYYPHLAKAVDKVVTVRGIKIPRIGIIPDKNPNAFTFGWTKNSARIVITQGILEYLNKDEQEAVVAHELGHVVHNDFILMTIVFAIPLILLTIARWCYYASRGFFQSSDEEGVSVAIAIALTIIAALSYVAYYISYLVSLIISRIREYYADEHAAELTENPNVLSSALVTIAYGLLMERNIHENRSSRVRALKGLGIFDSRGAAAFTVSSTGGNGKYSKDAIQAAAAWDLFNPWAKYFQIFSTHPLPAKRIMRLNEQCEIYGIKPDIDFSYANKIKEEQAGKSMIPEFLTDITMIYLPILIFVALIALTIVWIFTLAGLYDSSSGTMLDNMISNLLLFWAIGFYLIGFGVLVKVAFKYKSGFGPTKVVELVKYVKASPIRTVPAILKGTIVGRGVPGYYFGEDMLLQDETGLIYVDYESLFPIFGNLIFAMRTIKKYIGTKVRVIGWYRRGPSPYFEIKMIESSSGRRNKNYRKQASYIWAIIAFIIGFFIFFLWIQITGFNLFMLF
ncbi:MAG: zinc metalloprotease HtpX [Candidatus Hodarchaeota archaeon]